MAVYAYLRDSTDSQDTENQRTGVDATARALGLVIDKYIIDDGISGTKEPEKRALGGLLRKISRDDIIICSELSRLGRKLFMIMSILEHCMKVGAKVYTVKDNYELGDNIQSKVLAFAFALSAEIERDLISQRTKEALAHKKANGIHIGRPKGSRNKNHKLDGREQVIRNYLLGGGSKMQLCRKLKTSIPTLNKFIKDNNISK